MPVASSYSEAELAEYMLSAYVLGPVATALGWAGLSSVQHAINAALRAYGVDDIAEATDAGKLEALARAEAWRQAAAATAGHYQFSADGQSLNRQQVHDHCLKQLALAEQDAAALGVGPGAVRVTRLRQVTPYDYVPDEVLEEVF